MRQEEILLKLLDRLDKDGIAYFVTGSFASNVHGVPRVTQDADIVVKASLKQLMKLAKDLEADFYVSEEAIREAVEQERIFNAIHFADGFKFDLIPLKKNPYDQLRFERRIPIEFEGKKIYFSSAEDIILAKLQWASLSDSERQVRDASGIAAVQGDSLDWNYLNLWADRLGVANLLAKIRPRRAE